MLKWLLCIDLLEVWDKMIRIMTPHCYPLRSCRGTIARRAYTKSHRSCLEVLEAGPRTYASKRYLWFAMGWSAGIRLRPDGARCPAQIIAGCACSV